MTNKKPHLLWVVNTPVFGGLEKFTLNLLAHLDGFVHTFAVTAQSELARRARMLPECVVRELPLPRKLGRWRGWEVLMPARSAKITALLDAAIAAAAADNPAPLVIFQTFQEKFIGTPLARRRNCRVLWVEHGPLPTWLTANPLLLNLYRTRAALTQGIVAVSEQVADSLRAQGLTVVTTIPNAVPPPEFPSGPESPHEKFRIGYVGRLEAVKGLDRLTELIPQLDDQRFAVVIAGAGSWEPRLRALARRCPALTLLPFTDDVGGILRGLDLLLYPTRAAGEGLPLIILEAFHHGIPVIARAHGGIPAVVKHDVNGILLAEDAAAAYAGAIRELAGDDARYRRLADGARATVAGPFAFTRHCAAYRERIMLALTAETLPYRVAYISGEDRLDHGGGAHTVEMAAALAARAAGVDLIVPRRFPAPAPGLLPANVRIIRAPLKLFGKTFLPRGLGALRQLRLTPPGLIIERYYCTGSLGAVLARQTGAPLVSEANHPHHREVQRRYRLPGWLADRLALRVLAPATAIIAPTPKLVPASLRARVLTLPWGVNRARFHRISAGQFSATPRTVVFSGSFQPWHGVELLLQTMCRTLTDPLHWLIVGMGAREADFRAQCRQAGIPADRCTIIPSLPYAQMPELLARGCLGFAPYDPERHPAYRETGFYWTPFKILEYLATGLPVVTTDAPVLQALVAERGFGLCVPPDAEALAQAVRRLATEPAAWQAAHAAIARDFTDAYSWDAFVCHLLARMQPPG